MKDAKAEAQKEIEEYRKQKEEEFKKYEAEVRHSHPATHFCPADAFIAQARK